MTIAQLYPEQLEEALNELVEYGIIFAGQYPFFQNHYKDEAHQVLNELRKCFYEHMSTIVRPEEEELDAEDITYDDNGNDSRDLLLLHEEPIPCGSKKGEWCWAIYRPFKTSMFDLTSKYAAHFC